MSTDGHQPAKPASSGARVVSASSSAGTESTKVSSSRGRQSDGRTTLDTVISASPSASPESVKSSGTKSVKISATRRPIPRSDYPPTEYNFWPVTTEEFDYAARGAWSARLASHVWREARTRGDDAAFADAALFTGVVLDSALDRLYTVVRPAFKAARGQFMFQDWLTATNDAIRAAFSETAAALPPGTDAPEFFNPPHRAQLVRAILDWHWRVYDDSRNEPSRSISETFCRTPDFTLLEKFDAAHLDSDTHTLVESWFSDAQDRVWDATPASSKQKYSSSGTTFEEEVEKARASGLLESDDHEWDEPDFDQALRPPTFTMEQLQHLLYNESQGRTTALRDYLASFSASSS